MDIGRNREKESGFLETKALLGESISIPRSNGLGSRVHELFPEIVGRSPQVINLLNSVYKASRTDSSVLICGESGTGKELIASALHRLSARSHKRFVPINCSAIPENLLESELFGHEKGAFTGAASRRIGYFEAAHGGTIFLDEIGDMHPSLQAKLLRVLQEKQYSPIGSSLQKNTDVRIVAATNVNLPDAVKAARFREDLYFRLNVLPMTLPPLREREGDVALLLEHFLEVKNRSRPYEQPCYLDFQALAVLNEYQWPGNVRELQNLVERLVGMSEGGRIGREDLPHEILNTVLNSVDPKSEEVPPREDKWDINPGTQWESVANLVELPLDGLDLTKVIEHLENLYICQALKRTNNNKNQAAKLLGLNRTTLVERIKKRKLAPLNLPSKEL